MKHILYNRFGKYRMFLINCFLLYEKKCTKWSYLWQLDRLWSFKFLLHWIELLIDRYGILKSTRVLWVFLSLHLNYGTILKHREEQTRTNLSLKEDKVCPPSKQNKTIVHEPHFIKYLNLQHLIDYRVIVFWLIRIQIIS